MKKYLFILCSSVFLLASCGGDDEIDPNTTTTFTKKHNKVNWEQIDGDEKGNMWFTNNHFYWRLSDGSNIECINIPINGSITDLERLQLLSVYSFITFPLVNKGDTLKLQVKYEMEDVEEEIIVYEEYWIFTVLGNTLKFNWAYDVDGIDGDIEIYHKTSSDLPNCN